MSEFSSEQHDEVTRIRDNINVAVEIVSGSTNVDPLVVFPNPRDTERREDISFDAEKLDEGQEAAFRAVMLELGPGRSDDKNLDLNRLIRVNVEDSQDSERQPQWKAFLHGGQVHKALSEFLLVSEQEIRPSVIIIGGAIDRKLPEKEKQLTAEVLKRACSPEGWKPTPEDKADFEKGTFKLGEGEDAVLHTVADNEFDAERQMFEILGTVGKFAPYDEPREINAAYQVVSKDEYRFSVGQDGAQTSEDRGQFVLIGEAAGVPVVQLRVDRFPDPEDSDKYIQLANDHKISIAAELVVPGVEMNDTNIGFVTSRTYEPSCELEAQLAVETSGKEDMTAQVLSYGTERLAKVKDSGPAAPPALNQLAGEAHKAAAVLQKIDDVRSI